MSRRLSIFEIIEVLPSFKRPELMALKNRINALLTDNREQRQSLENEDWLLHGVIIELKARGEIINDRFRLKSSQSFHNYESRATDVRELITRELPNLNATQLRAVGEFLARELIRYLASIGRPLKLDEVLNNIHLTVRAINQSFPGYIECGLLSLLVERMLEGVERGKRQ